MLLKHWCMCSFPLSCVTVCAAFSMKVLVVNVVWFWLNMDQIYAARSPFAELPAPPSRTMVILPFLNNLGSSL